VVPVRLIASGWGQRGQQEPFGRPLLQARRWAESAVRTRSDKCATTHSEGEHAPTPRPWHDAGSGRLRQPPVIRWYIQHIANSRPRQWLERGHSVGGCVEWTLKLF